MEPVFALKQALARYDDYQIRIHECDGEVERVLAALAINQPIPTDPLPKPKHRTRQPNQLSFDVRKAIYQLVGNDITQTHGFGPYLALRMITECGPDMSKWPSAGHFTS